MEEMKANREDVLLAVAKLIWKYEITIADLYTTLGVDLDNYRVDASQEVSEISGILKGWSTSPDTDY
jgi:hypothetical protein